MPKISTRDARAIAKALHNSDDFTTHGSMSGRSGPFTSWDSGRLPEKWVDMFAQRADYAVFSYATPIAFRVDGAWIVPDARYSVTTTRQQSTVRYAIDLAAERPGYMTGVSA